MKTILIIEDTPDLLENLTDSLRMTGYNVIPVKNAEEAWVHLRDPLPDLVISDITMAGMNGLDFARIMKRDVKLRHIPLVIFSARPLQEYQQEAIADGVNGFIQKPSSLDQIISFVDKMLS